MNKKNQLLCFFFFLSVGLFAQNDSIPAINTDRPTNSTSPILVPKGVFQIETGFIYNSEVSDYYTKDELNVLGTMFRYGLFDNFELRLSGSFSDIDYTYKELGTDSTLSGFGNVSFGFKVHIVEEKGLRPELSLVADMYVRHVGPEGLRPTYSYPVSKIAASNTLSEKFSLGYNLGLAYNGEDAEGFFIYSVILYYTIFPKAAFFIEPYGNFDSNGFPNHYIDGGFTYLIRQNMQLDISGGMSIGDNKNRASESINEKFISLGFSWKLPK
ncbi:MAG: hypothetical protein DRJ05_03870 [Bacteroidetes bacterium]|nr:MAG: hypothetical protein DRJ05_03870 [Bacteroidota bacterium]